MDDINTGYERLAELQVNKIPFGRPKLDLNSLILKSPDSKLAEIKTGID